jgi:NAD(P)-dependent dehydrogenase (short-subunit alcohol dehydrogenase family)
VDLTNASAIVSGGAGGIRSATVRRLAQKGAKVAIVAPACNALSTNSATSYAVLR